MSHTTAALDQAMAIQHRVDGALGRNFDSGESADQALSDLAGTPAGMLALHVENEILHLKRQLMRVAVWTTASIGKPLNAAFLVTIEDLVAGLAGDAELPAQFRHRLAG
jgi:hypothetical protein